MYLCFPSNPHGALASMNYLKKAVNLAKKYDFILAIDECYIDYCIHCEKHKHIARKDFCLERIRSGNICKDCLSLLVKQSGSS